MSTVWYHEACRAMPDCNREGRIFLSVLHTYDRFFFLAPTFISERRFFNNAVTSIVDVRHIVMAWQWRLMMSLCSATYILTIANTWEFSIFILLGRIRLFIPRLNPGFPSLMCKGHCLASQGLPSNAGPVIARDGFLAHLSKAQGELLWSSSVVRRPSPVVHRQQLVC